MTQAKPKLQTFADFLAYHDDTDSYYELTNGELIEVPPESYDNLRRALKHRANTLNIGKRVPL